jgi:hypothetical protein
VLGIYLQSVFIILNRFFMPTEPLQVLPKDAEGDFITAQEKSDVVHDLLAFLAEQMLEMNKQKQRDIKGFLGWPETEIGAKVEGLSLNTKVQEYHYWPQFDELLTIPKKNKRKLKVLRSSPPRAAEAAAAGVRCVPGEV